MSFRIDSPKPCEVLIVEDHADTLFAIVAVLTAAGYEVDVAENGEEALWALSKRRYDLLLTDLWMPLLDGEALIQEIRRQDRFRDMPIVLMTASGDTLSELRHRIQAIIRKPCTGATILQALRELNCHAHA